MALPANATSEAAERPVTKVQPKQLRGRTAMTKDEALKLALEALKQCNIFAFAGGLGVRAMEHTEAMEAIKEALAQPAREWVGLTDEEVQAMDSGANSISSFYAGALWADAKLKELNHDNA